MGIYECLWVSWVFMSSMNVMGVYRCLWVSMGAYECWDLRVSMDIYGYLWVSGLYRYLLVSMGLYGFMGVYEYL